MAISLLARQRLLPPPLLRLRGAARSIVKMRPLGGGEVDSNGEILLLLYSTCGRCKKQ